jgi:hypothetical protein
MATGDVFRSLIDSNTWNCQGTSAKLFPVRWRKKTIEQRIDSVWNSFESKSIHQNLTGDVTWQRIQSKLVMAKTIKHPMWSRNLKFRDLVHFYDMLFKFLCLFYPAVIGQSSSPQTSNRESRLFWEMCFCICICSFQSYEFALNHPLGSVNVWPRLWWIFCLQISIAPMHIGSNICFPKLWICLWLSMADIVTSNLILRP